ncbi:unnamed protein product [Cyprideis torosa]|uniref:Uncharacterized protein n=1 Tax=Cyprideis torosa TaxID=163714 RepID=A0A7R8ZWV0_9CRUS|nr:unnamed protein product [Cyprideis torosa]CAG0906005.1 unnamed protein product [Cyprideis torosa]
MMFSLSPSLVFGLCWILVACLATTFKPYRKISGYRCAPSFPYTGPRPAPSDRHCMLWGMSHGCTVMQAGPECHCCGTVEPNSTTSILAPTANLNEPCAVSEQCTSGVCNQGYKICSNCADGLLWPDDDACYEVLKLSTSSLPAAQASCAAWGGIMAAPLSESHNDWIYSSAEQEPTIWLGIKQNSGNWLKIEDNSAVPFMGQWFPPFESYCRQVVGGYYYTGTLSTTVSGRTCQR